MKKLTPKERSALKRRLKVLNSKLGTLGHKLNKVEARIEILEEEASYQSQVQNTLENMYDEVHYKIEELMERLETE